MVAVVSASEKLDGSRDATQSWNASDRFTTYEYTSTWQAVTDVATKDATVILGSSLIPQMFEADQYNPYARVISRRPVRTENPLYWDIAYTYSTAAPTAQNASDQPDPLGIPVKWSVTTEQIQLPMGRDINGDPIKLSNGLPPNPPLMVTRLMTVFRAERNEETFPSNALVNMAGRINSVNFLGCDAGTLMLRMPQISEENAGVLIYWNTHYEFVYYALGWQPRLLNAGYMGFDPDVPAALVPIRGVDGQEITSPWPLDASGQPLSVSDINAGNFTYTDVLGYESANFNTLGLALP